MATDLIKEFLGVEELKQYNASLKQIDVLKKEIQDRNTIIEQLRNGITETNKTMHERLVTYMMNR
jgi:wobble nucleotide-excising tRNase